MLVKLRNIISILLIALMSACVSNHNLMEGEGAFDGGYQVNKVSEGIFYIYARTNGSLTPNYVAAKKMFMTQAQNLCGSKNILVTKANSQLDNSKFNPLIVTELTGFAICADKGLSKQQVEEAIKKYENS